MTRPSSKVKAQLKAASAAYDKAVGARIREMRMTLPKSQEEIGELVGMSGSSFSRVEKGETSLEPFQIARLARVFSCRPGDLINDIGSQSAFKVAS